MNCSFSFVHLGFVFIVIRISLQMHEFTKDKRSRCRRNESLENIWILIWKKNIDRPIKRRNNAKVKGYFWSSLSLRFVIVKKCQACCLICQTLQDGCLEFLLSSCFVLVAAFSLLTYAFCSLVAEFHFLRVQGKQNIIVILEVPQI